MNRAIAFVLVALSSMDVPAEAQSVLDGSVALEPVLVSGELLEIGPESGDRISSRSPGRSSQPGDGQGPAATGVIQGTITDAGSSSGIDGISITLYDEFGEWLWEYNAQTDAGGNYSVDDVAVGTYFMRADGQGYIGEVYDGIICPGSVFGLECDPTLGTALIIGSGTVLSADLALEKGGTITGTVTDEDTSLAIDGISIQIYNEDRELMGSGSTDGAGVYAASGLPTGTYFAYATTSSSSASPYIWQAYPDVQCPQNCDFRVGQTIAVTEGQTTASIDFELGRGGDFFGTVSETASGLGIDRARVRLYDSHGHYLSRSWRTNGDGNYSATGLPPGRYFALAVDSDFIDQLYGGISCENRACEIRDGTPIEISTGSSSGPVDFPMWQGTGAVSGTVTDGVLGLAGASVSIVNPQGIWIASGSTDSNGEYVVSGLDPGTYYAVAAASEYIGKLYDGIDCPDYRFGCEVSDGQSIVVATGQTVMGIDFILVTGGKVAGKIRESGTGEGIRFPEVRIFDSTGNPVMSSWASQYGYYVSSALAPGAYYTVTFNSRSYIDELYDDIVCVGPLETPCDVTAGNQLQITAGTTLPDINFDLDKGGRILGRLTEEDTHLGLSGFTVEVFDAAGRQVSYGGTSYHGTYWSSAGGLPTGQYYARTSMEDLYRDEVFDDRPCNGACDPTIGDPIDVTTADDTSGIDFGLLLMQVLTDGFESGDTSAWSSAVP